MYTAVRITGYSHQSYRDSFSMNHHNPCYPDRSMGLNLSEYIDYVFNLPSTKVVTVYLLSNANSPAKEILQQRSLAVWDSGYFIEIRTICEGNEIDDSDNLKIPIGTADDSDVLLPALNFLEQSLASYLHL